MEDNILDNSIGFIIKGSLKEEAIYLRTLGLSQNRICEILKVPKTSLRRWIRDIILTDQQKGKLIEDRSRDWSEKCRIKRLSKIL